MPCLVASIFKAATLYLELIIKNAILMNILKSKYKHLKSLYTEITSKPDYKDKWYSWVFPIVGVILFILLILIANAYFHLLIISTSYITRNYPTAGNYLFIFGVPFYFFIMLVSGFAQANGYTDVLHKKYFSKKRTPSFSHIL